MKYVLAAVFSVLVLAGCGKHDKPSPTITNTPSPATTTTTTLFPPPTDQPSDSPVTSSPPPPFENPTLSTGIGKG
jgi:PBP1b-binding outer membrane lipoprotein LpoB